VTRNLCGARIHLETSLSLDAEVAKGQGIDVRQLLEAIDVRLAAVAQIAPSLTGASGPLIDLLPVAPPTR
jgi:acid phosphatase class B